MADDTCIGCRRSGLTMRRQVCGTCYRHGVRAPVRCTGCGAAVQPARGQRAGQSRCETCRPAHVAALGAARRERIRSDPIRHAQHRTANGRAKARWLQTDRGRFLRYAANYRRHSGVTVTWQEMVALFEAQEGRCAICTKQIVFLPGRGTVANAHLDHCHATKRVRGWLCSPCNRALGMLRDDPAVLRAAADYLERCVDLPEGTVGLALLA